MDQHWRTDGAVLKHCGGTTLHVNLTRAGSENNFASYHHRTIDGVFFWLLPGVGVAY